MAHVKCRYDHYSCQWNREKCWECNDSPTDDYDGLCKFMDCYTGYFEKTSKSVNFDGKNLTVGNTFFAIIPDCEIRPWAEDIIIDYLEIDGIVYYGEKEDKTNGKNNVE